MRKTIKTTAILLSLSILWCACGAFVGSAMEESSEAPYAVHELTESRTSDSKTFLMSDGSFDYVAYASDVHYLSTFGEYLEIDNAITQEISKSKHGEYDYRNKANSYTARFADVKESNYHVMLEKDGYIVKFGLLGVSSKDAALYINEDSEFCKNNVLKNNSIGYYDVYPNVDVVYETTNAGLKEYIILNDPTDHAVYHFKMLTENLKCVESDGAISFVNVDGNEIFYIGNLFAVDNSGNMTQNVTCNILSFSEGEYIIELTVDSAYFTDNDLSYPVVIDPSIMVSGSTTTFDSYVSSLYPSNNYYLSDYLRTGKDTGYGVRRAYIKFTLPTNILSNSVTYAYLRLKKDTGSTPSLLGYRVTGSWTTSSLTWNNKPGYNTAAVTAPSYNDSGTWYRLNSSSIVKSWLAGTYSNFGFLIKDTNESSTSQWTTFFSSDADSPNKPELHINYTYYGNRPYLSYNYGSGQNCMGYALNFVQYIGYEELLMTQADLNGCTTSADLLNYTNTLSVAWMNSNISGRFNSIYSYNSDINSTQYRVVLRAGCNDTDGNGSIELLLPDNPNYESSDRWDYHWWYQTDDGQWAEKMAWYAPNLVSGTSGTTNPQNVSWNGGFYNSPTCKYFAIDN